MRTKGTLKLLCVTLVLVSFWWRGVKLCPGTVVLSTTQLVTPSLREQFVSHQFETLFHKIEFCHLPFSCELVTLPLFSVCCILKKHPETFFGPTALNTYSESRCHVRSVGWTF